jgi:hypothetical protein
MRRLYPQVIFDWKKITRQLAEKREVCRGYRSRRRAAGVERRERLREPFHAVYDPAARALYVDGDGAEGVAFLDVLVSLERQGGNPSAVTAASSREAGT